MYLNIHFKRTEEAYKQYETEFNKMVKKQYPVEYRKHTLKSGERGTMFFIFRAFYKHLENLRNAKKSIQEPFEINNCALGTMQGNERSTIYRHLQRLQNLKANGEIIIKEWEPMMHQKKYGRYFELSINHKYLVSDKSPELTSLLIGAQPDILERAAKAGNDDLFLHPSFEVIFPLIVAFCNPIEIQETLINNNIEIGLCSKVPKHREQETFNKKHGSIINLEKNALAPSSDIPGAIFPGAAIKDFYGSELMPHIQRAMWYLFTFLYPGKVVTGYRLTQTVDFIYAFFSGHKSYWTRSALWVKFVNLQVQTIKNHPSWQQQDPWIWLNPDKKGSIKYTEDYYYSRVLPMEAKNKEWNSNRKLLEREILWYWKNKGVPGAYRRCKEILGRKGKGELLEAFNKCLIDKEEFSNKMFVELRQNYFS